MFANDSSMNPFDDLPRSARSAEDFVDAIETIFYSRSRQRDRDDGSVSDDDAIISSSFGPSSGGPGLSLSGVKCSRCCCPAFYSTPGGGSKCARSGCGHHYDEHWG